MVLLWRTPSRAWLRLLVAGFSVLPGPVAVAANPAGSARAQADESLQVRVVQGSPGGLVEIDRGSQDGLWVGDRVQFNPRGGPTLFGRVIDVQERSAGVELEGSQAALAPGTRGEVRLPAERFQKAPASPSTKNTQPVAGESAETPGDSAPTPENKPAWQRIDDWRAGQPLLQGLERVRPADRARQWSGNVWLALDQIVTDINGRGDGFYRLGSRLVVDNPFDHGGQIEWQGDLSQRITYLNDQDDDQLGLLRIERLAYRIGGTRRETDGYAFGRFLNDVPELGLLDGASWVHRTEGGDRYGASLGYLPQPDPQLESAEDLAVAAFYQWNLDETERLSATVAYQRTFHNWSSDRDLFVIKGRYLPDNGWKLFSSALIDAYTGKDDLKDGLELTQWTGSLWRSWRSQGLRLVAYQQRIPQLQGDLVPAISLAQIAAAHTERGSVEVWTDLGSKTRLTAEGGGWVDEEDNGADGRVELAFSDVFGKRETVRLGGFLSQGKFTDVLGYRVGYDQALAGGQMRLGYEYALQDNVGFSDENDDLPQQRLSVSQDWNTGSGWSFNLHADWVIFDQDSGLWLGLFASRAF